MSKEAMAAAPPPGAGAAARLTGHDSQSWWRRLVGEYDTAS